MSAYRTAPSERERPKDVRELTIRTLGTFAMVIWCGLALVSGAVIAAAVRWATPNHTFDMAVAMRTVGIGTVAVTALAALLVALSDEQLRFVVRVDDGILEVSKRVVLRRLQVQAFRLRDVAQISVDDHGEDHIAVFVHSGKEERTRVFVTVHGDDARRVETFLDCGVAAWRAITAEPAP